MQCALHTASRLAAPASRRTGASARRAASSGDIMPSSFRAAPPTRVGGRATTLFEELDKELEAMSRAFFAPSWAADPFGREALAPAPRAVRATASLPTLAHHTLGAADIKVDADNALTLTIDVPGVPKAGLSVEVDADDRVLTIAGSRAEVQEEKQDKEGGDKQEEEGEEEKNTLAPRAVRVERAASFLRRFALPPTADIDGITSTLRDGVLTVRVPSAAVEEKPAVKRIEVQ